MMTKRIKADLIARGRPSHKAEQKILATLNSAPDQVFTLRDLCGANGKHNGSFWAAAYHLASTGQIGIADRKYHVWSACTLVSQPMRIRTVVFHNSRTIEDLIVREQWADRCVTQEMPQVQAPLFGNVDDVASLSNVDLDGLLQRIQKERFERALKARYEGGDVNTCKPIIEALRGVNVADPVVYVHSDHTCTFVTMTSTKEMPIKITLKSAGKEARTIDNIEHITLHGLPVVSTLKSGFGGDR